MALLAKYGSFAKKSDTTGTQAITGVGFQPKIVFLFGNDRTSDGAHANAQMFFGAMNDSVGEPGNDAFMIWADGDTTSRGAAGLAVVRSELATDADGVNDSQGQLSSIDSDGFTINWSVQDNEARIICYLALGGSDITDSNTFSTNVGTSTGSYSRTGLGFQPDFMMMWNTSSQDADNSIGAKDVWGGFGAMTATDERAYMAFFGEHNTAAASADTSRVFKDTEAFGQITTTQRLEGDFTSFDADGYTLNWGTHDAYNAYYQAVAMAGMDVKVGSFQQPTSTGQQVISGLGFKPKGIIFFSAQASAQTIQSGMANTIGFADSELGNGTIWWGASDAVSPTVADSYLDRTKAIKFMTPGTPTLVADAEIAWMEQDAFVLNWTNVDATQRYIGYIAFGETLTKTTQTATAKARIRPPEADSMLEDFDSYSTGSLPVEWFKVNNGTTTVETYSGGTPSHPSSNTLYHVAEPAGQTDRWAFRKLWFTVPYNVEVDVIYITNNDYGGLAIGYQYAGGSQFEARPSPYSDHVQVRGIGTAGGYPSFTVNTGIWYKLRLEATSAGVVVKLRREDTEAWTTIGTYTDLSRVPDGLVGTTTGGYTPNGTRFDNLKVFAVGSQTMTAKARIVQPGTALTPGNTSEATSAITGSLTWSHTVASNNNRALIIKIAGWGSRTITDVTFNGTSGEQIERQTNGYGFSEAWIITNPDVGTYNVVVTFSGSSYSAAGAIDFYNVNVNDPIGATNTNNATSGDITGSLTTLYDNSYAMDAVFKRGAATITADSPQVESYNEIFSVMAGGGSYKPAASPTSYTMSWTTSGGSDWTTVMFELREYVDFTEAQQTVTAKANIVCIALPQLVSPANFETDVEQPVYLVWKIPETCNDANVHAHVQIDDTSNAFGSLEKDLYSFRDANFEYWDGDSWEPYPTDGVSNDFAGNQARVQVSGLTVGTKYWRVRGGRG